MEQNGAHAYLIQVNEPHAGGQYALDQDVVTLGRVSSSSLAFPGDDSISRQHVRIVNRLGLLWLEDLDSTNGTFFSPPGGGERRLTPRQPVLLLEGSVFRLGIRVCFEVKGVASSQDEATRMLRQRLQQMLLNLYQNLSQYPPLQQEEHLKAIHDLQEQIGAACSEEELALLAAKGMQDLQEGMLKTVRFDPPGAKKLPVDDVIDLPPLPDDLPDPGDPQRLKTLMNAFITDIRICFPNSHYEDEPDR